jgi:uncharacterized surface protein with fasciclin (FAS1) repeats
MTRKHFIRRATVAGLLAGTLAVAAGPAAGGAPAQQKDLVGTAAGAGQFKTLISLAKQAGLAAALKGPGPLTVFAPTDAAFRKVPRSTLNTLANNRAQLRKVLLYHVAKGNVKAAQVVTLKRAKTLAGPAVRVKVRGGSVFLNGSARVVKTDIAASNGTIHVINRVLRPPA